MSPQVIFVVTLAAFFFFSRFVLAFKYIDSETAKGKKRFETVNIWDAKKTNLNLHMTNFFFGKQ